jgi:hypothetical protein
MCVLSLLSAFAADAQNTYDMVSGAIQKVDDAARTLSVKTKQGAETVVDVTEKTVKYGTKAVKEGTQAVVQHTTHGAKKTAHAIKTVGKDTVHTLSGVVTKIDLQAQTATVKTADGVEHVLTLAKDGVISAGHAVGTTAEQGGKVAGKKASAAGEATADAARQAADYLAQAAKSGAKVTVYYTDKAGKKIAHAFQDAT